MNSARVTQLTCVIAMMALAAIGQTITSNIIGTVTDPGQASIPNVEVQVRNMATGETRTATTNAEGIFRFTTLPAGAYTLTMKASTGFKTYRQENLNLASSETRDLGKIQLQLGSVTEEVSVTAIATPVQTASSEKSALVDGNQLNQIALRGRDLFGFLQLIPGVTGTTGGETTNTSLPGTINGGGTKLFSVDGVVDMDTGSNGTVHYSPNIDSIAEIRVLTSNFQAEYGHNSAGVINVVTKGGGQAFHGSAWSTKRHEMFNAMNFFDNIQNNKKPTYRYFVGGFSVGGPVYIPKLFNTNKTKVFFFVSQEYTKQKPAAGTNYYRVPTALERTGDFSQTIDPGTGKTYPMYDPVTRAQLTETQKANIGAFVVDPVSATWGQNMMNFFPLPNRCDLNGNAAGCWTETDATQINRRNYKYEYAGKHPRRNDMFRFDFNLTSKLTSWWRFVNDYDLEHTSFNVPLFTPSLASGCNKAWSAAVRVTHPECWAPYSEDHPNPGKGHGVGITYTITPTLVNEFTFGKSYNTWDWYPHYVDQMDRALMNNPPHWFDEKSGGFKNDGNLARPNLSPGAQNYAFWIPNVTGGSQSSPGSGRPYTNWNDIYSFADSISWVKGSHSFKAGMYYDRTGKVQQGGSGNYLGSYNFSGGVYDLGRGDANMYVGNFNTYSEGARIIGDFWFTGWELFVQDNWRVTKRLTLDLGVRFYYLKPQENLNKTSAIFKMSAYDPAKAARLYVNGCNVPVPATSQCPTKNQVALDQATGATTFPSLVGTFVPGSGEYFNGNVVAGTGGVPLTLWEVTKFAPAPRVGFAWDIFGNGRTAIRGGFGQSFNRGDGNQIMGPYAGVPPIAYTRTVYYQTVAAVPGLANVAGVGPISNGGLYGKQPYEDSITTSFGVQQNVGFGTVVEATFVGQYRRHTNQGLALNENPIWADYDPANQNPWSPTNPKRAWNSNFYRPLKGIGGVSRSEFRGTNNYNSLQVSVRRSMSKGLSYGVAYTFAKSMNPGSWGAYDNDPQYGEFFKDRRMSSSFSGAPHVLVFNYIYEVPGLGKRLNSRALGWITDNWTISGITQMQGPFFNSAVGCCSFSSTTNTNAAPEFTGGAEGARTIVLRNATVPKEQVTWDWNDWTKNNTFDYKAFLYPMPCSWVPMARATDGIGKSIQCFGNAGSGPNYKVPLTYNNWDLTFAKNIPLKGERRQLTFRAEMYNFPNHTQFSGLNASPSYNFPNWQNGTYTQTNNQLGRYTSARTARRMAMSLRLQF